MPRRFITAEDVRRASGELVVDEGTVVTPQALEAAVAAGVAIRQAGGAPYVEPAPDRGPDASRAVHHLPHLPEPAAELGGATGVIVTAVGKNRPGVLAEITGALAAASADVRDISQRTVQDYFHLVLTVALGTAAEFESFKQCMECLGGKDDYVVRVMHERVFRFMHRI
jgi:ACT domain-containing protein